jgi:hypothetical protein
MAGHLYPGGRDLWRTGPTGGDVLDEVWQGVIMARILLIDADSKIPNLALMQISAYHKSIGDEVSLNNPNDPQTVYLSCIFTKNRGRTLGIAKMYPDAQIIFGGSGMNYNWLPEQMQKIKPDYDLYPSTYSIGFTTRGCIRHCTFCIVHDKEGQYRRWQHVSEFNDSRFKTVMIMDNNWYADKDWFMDNTQYIIDNNLSVIEHGMDIRILTTDIAERLSQIKFDKPIKFAWDNWDDMGYVIKGINILESVGINVRQNVQFYVLVGYNTTEEQDKERCRLLKKMNTNAFVMPFKKTAWTKRIGRWANRKWLYWSMDIDEYRE